MSRMERKCNLKLEKFISGEGEDAGGCSSLGQMLKEATDEGGGMKRKGMEAKKKLGGSTPSPS